jgi:hypothetical protein
MIGLILAWAITTAASAPASEQTPASAVAPEQRAPSRELSLSLGAQAGFPFLVGARAGGVIFYNGKQRFFFDLLIEPSAQLQSLSLGGAYHIADSIAFVGARLRFVQVQPVWSRDYNASRDNHFGAGIEAGVRIPVADRRGLVLISAHLTLLPAAASQLQTWFGLSAGFSWQIWRNAI